MRPDLSSCDSLHRRTFRLGSMVVSHSPVSISNTTSLSFITHISSRHAPTTFHDYCGVYRSRKQRRSSVSAKFDKFQGDNVDSLSNEKPPAPTEMKGEDDEEDDSCLPSDLVGAVKQSGKASALFLSSGGLRAIVELLIPQLQLLDDEGAQAELWELSRIFLEALIEESRCQKVRAIFPDAGAAAMLKYRWKDAPFRFSSLNDRKPLANDDEIVVMIVPDYQMLQNIEKIASDLADDSPRPLVMWNPRLISEDVGVGINVRNLRRYFLSTFTTVYSMKPLPSGAVFKCYPGLWKVFYDDKDRPNRYLLAKELMKRPDSEDLEIIFGNAGKDEASPGTSVFSQASSLFSSINRFMRAITK